MKHAFALVCLFSSAAFAQGVAKVYSDQGAFFIHATADHPVALGSELPMATDPAGLNRQGTAIVMEAKGALIRLTLDDEATPGRAASFVTMMAGSIGSGW